MSERLLNKTCAVNRQVRRKAYGVKESLSQCGNVYSSQTLPFPTVNANRVVAGKAIRSTGELDERREIYVECSPFILTRQTKDLGVLNRQLTQNAVPREAGSGDD